MLLLSRPGAATAVTTRAAAAFYACALGLVYNTYQTRKKREGRGKREMGKREREKKRKKRVHYRLAGEAAVEIRLHITHKKMQLILAAKIG